VRERAGLSMRRPHVAARLRLAFRPADQYRGHPPPGDRPGAPRRLPAVEPWRAWRLRDTGPPDRLPGLFRPAARPVRHRELRPSRDRPERPVAVLCELRTGDRAAWAAAAGRLSGDHRPAALRAQRVGAVRPGVPPQRRPNPVSHGHGRRSAGHGPHSGRSWEAQA
jgi:hypothetical protein